MKKLKRNTVTGLILTLFLAGMLSVIFVTPAKAQYAVDPRTVALWHFDEVFPDGHQEITPDATGRNPGILISAPHAPVLVKGKFDKAMSFDGANGVYVPIRFLVGFPPSPQPIYIPISPSLDVQKEIKIEAWINVHGFKNVTYNNIIVKCTRYDASWENVTRIYGIAVKAGISENSCAVPLGALSGYVYTDAGGLNEIVTTESVITLNEWVHVAFTRNLDTGMHIYVNGYEKDVMVIHGVQNPTGSVINGTEVYLGHDSLVTLDEIHVSDLAPETETAAAQIDIGPNLLVAVIVVSVIFAVAWLLRKAIQMWVIRSRS